MWLAAASAIYCRLAGKWALYQFPYLQWLDAVPWWRLNARMTVYVVTAAAVPTLVALIIAFCLISKRLPNKLRPSLYGQTDWAGVPEMEDGGIKLKRQIF
jgi:hypothetical protein